MFLQKPLEAAGDNSAKDKKHVYVRIIKLKFDSKTGSRKVMESHGKRSWSDVEDLLVAFLATDWDEELIAAILAASQQEALGRS